MGRMGPMGPMGPAAGPALLLFPSTLRLRSGQALDPPPSHRQRPRLAVDAAEEAGGFGVAFEAVAGGVPGERAAAEQKTDAAEEHRGGHADDVGQIALTETPGLDAVEEVALVARRAGDALRNPVEVAEDLAAEQEGASSARSAGPATTHLSRRLYTACSTCADRGTFPTVPKFRRADLHEPGFVCPRGSLLATRPRFLQRPPGIGLVLYFKASVPAKVRAFPCHQLSISELTEVKSPALPAPRVRAARPNGAVDRLRRPPSWSSWREVHEDTQSDDLERLRPIMAPPAEANWEYVLSATFAALTHLCCFLCPDLTARCLGTPDHQEFCKVPITPSRPCRPIERCAAGIVPSVDVRPVGEQQFYRFLS